MTIFYSADHHFGHHGIIGLCKRPFETAEEMDEMMIRRHNDRVERSDDAYFIGDFSGSNDPKYLAHIFNKLKGRKHLIVGNHDNKHVLRLGWSSQVTHRRELKVDGQIFILGHYPERSWDKMYKGAFHLYGHTHGKLPGVGRSIDVGVDAWDFQPILASEAIERMKAWNHDFDTYAPELPEIFQGPDEEQSFGMRL